MGLHKVKAETVQTMLGFVIGQVQAVLEISGHLGGYVSVNGELRMAKGKRLLWLLLPGAEPFPPHFRESAVSVKSKPT